jgi:multiple sugar transport system substrate-binding protein
LRRPSVRKAVAALAAAMLLLAACSQVSSVVPDIAPADDESASYTGTLRLGLRSAVTPSGPYPVQRGNQGVLRSRSEAFMEKYPGVEIEVQVVHFERDFPKMLADPTLMPDIIQLTPNEARLLMLPHLESLADRIEDHAAAWEGGYAKLIDYLEIGGEAFLLPFTSDPLLTLYRTDVFGELQLPEPRDGWTYGDYAEIARSLTEAGYVVSLRESLSNMEPFIRGMGGVPASSDGTALSGYLDSEATAGAFIRFAGMIPESTSWTPEDPRYYSAVATLRASDGPAGIVTYPYAVAPIPSDVEGKRHNNTLMTGLAIPKSSAQPELAWEYLKFLMGDSDEEAIDFVVNNTLERQLLDTRIGHKPIYEEIKSWMRREIVQSPPATFDYLWYSDLVEYGLYPRHIFPKRSLDQLRSYGDVETARADLALWAKEIESYVESIVGTGSGG